MAVASKRYRSFISYSQQDKRWGRRLHSWLETYRVPVGVLAEVQDTSRRLGRFFRDEAEMPAAPDIGEVVREAIETAESLIVICSPRSARSQWVASEIAHFRKANPNGKLFAVVIDGAPNSGDPETECFPQALRRGGDADAMPTEPVGVDVRVDSKERICARLAAGLLDVDFDDLWQRDRRRAERRQRRAILSLSAMSAVFALLAGAAVWFGLSAQRQQHMAEAARVALQREYLAVMAEGALDDVLTSDLRPGSLTPADGAWMTLMQVEGAPFMTAREWGEGRILAVAHDGILYASRIENGDAFLRRSIAWLKGAAGPSVVLITSGHCEWMTLATEDWALPAQLTQWGNEPRDGSGPITADALRGVGVLIVGNAWDALEPPEMDAIEQFARQGGGVFLVGLGWSWAKHAADPDMHCRPAPQGGYSNAITAYPMNWLGQRFGLAWPAE